MRGRREGLSEPDAVKKFCWKCDTSYLREHLGRDNGLVLVLTPRGQRMLEQLIPIISKMTISRFFMAYFDACTMFDLDQGPLNIDRLQKINQIKE